MWGNLAKSALEATTGQNPSKLLQKIENVVAPRDHDDNDSDYDDNDDDDEYEYETDSDYEEYESEDGGDVKTLNAGSMLGDVWSSAKKGLSIGKSAQYQDDDNFESEEEECWEIDQNQVEENVNESTVDLIDVKKVEPPPFESFDKVRLTDRFYASKEKTKDDNAIGKEVETTVNLTNTQEDHMNTEVTEIGNDKEMYSKNMKSMTNTAKCDPGDEIMNETIDHDENQLENKTILENVFGDMTQTQTVKNEEIVSTRTTLGDDEIDDATALSVSEFFPKPIILCSTNMEVYQWIHSQYNPSLYELIMIQETNSTIYSPEKLEAIQRQGKVCIFFLQNVQPISEIKQRLHLNYTLQDFRYIFMSSPDEESNHNSDLDAIFFQKNVDLDEIMQEMACQLQQWYPQLVADPTSIPDDNDDKISQHQENFISEANNMYKPIVICGPSGVGKGTLINKLMEYYSEKYFGFSVSHTTRKPREGEIDGTHYNFTTVEAIKKDIDSGLFIEYAEVHGNFYGTSISAVESVQREGKICILDIDTQGVQNVKKSSLRAHYIFISPPSFEALEARLRGRGTESEKDIQKRLSNANREMKYAEGEGNFDRVFVNDDLDETFKTLSMQMMSWYPHIVDSKLHAKHHESDSNILEEKKMTSTSNEKDKNEVNEISQNHMPEMNKNSDGIVEEVVDDIGTADNLESIHESSEVAAKITSQNEAMLSNERDINEKCLQMEENFSKLEQSMKMQIQELQQALATQQNQHFQEIEQCKLQMQKERSRTLDTENFMDEMKTKFKLEKSEMVNEFNGQLKEMEKNSLRNKKNLDEKDREVTQLQKIIGELQRTMEDNRNGLESVEQEADDLHDENETLREQIEKYKRELESKHKEISKLQSDNTKMLGLQMELHMVEEARDREKKKLDSMSESLSDETAKISQERDESKALAVDLEQQIDALRADLNLVKADYARASAANANLQIAMEAFQKEREAEVSLFEEQKKAAEDANNAACEAKIHAAQKTNQKLMDEVQMAANNAVTNMMGEVETMEHKVEEYKKESINLRRSLDQAISRLQRTQEDVIDRSLMKNTLLDWHSKKGKARRDVLELMASFLHFSEVEKEKCGIGSANVTYRKVVDAVAPPISPAKVDTSSLAGDNVREKWVNFLLAECGDENPKDAET